MYKAHCDTCPSNKEHVCQSQQATRNTSQGETLLHFLGLKPVAIENQENFQYSSTYAFERRAAEIHPNRADGGNKDDYKRPKTAFYVLYVKKN